MSSMRYPLSIAAALAGAGLAACGDSEPATWTDPATQLVWTLDAAPTVLSAAAAAAHCDGLTTDDLTDWRLPTISELRTLVVGCAGTVTGGACGVTDACLSQVDCGGSCGACTPPSADACFWPADFRGVCDFTWSSKARSDDATQGWGVFFNNGQVGVNLLENTGWARCVRVAAM